MIRLTGKLTNPVKNRRDYYYPFTLHCLAVAISYIFFSDLNPHFGRNGWSSAVSMVLALGLVLVLPHLLLFLCQ